MIGGYRYRKTRNAIKIGILCVIVITVAIVSAVAVLGPSEEVGIQPEPRINESVVEVVVTEEEPESIEEIMEAINETTRYLEYLNWKRENNIYNLSEWHTWQRHNVSGLKDLKVNTTIYGYKILPSFQEHSISWGINSWWTHMPAPGKEFLFVFASMYMPGDSPEWDPSMSAVRPHRFYVVINGMIYNAVTDKTDPVEPIKELENVWDVDHIHTITPYGYGDVARLNGRSIRPESSYLRMGRSNKMDGWILYEIPAGTKPDEIQVTVNFGAHGSPQWSLMV